MDVDRNEVPVHEGVSIQERVGHEAVRRRCPEALRRNAYIRRGLHSMADGSPRGAWPEIRRGVLSEIGA